MSNQLIFEIGCEELPARFVSPTLAQLEREVTTRCAEARIAVSGVRVVGTPRRLTLLIDEVARTQEDLEEVRTGPPERAAFRDGEPTKAAQGFARGQGVAVEDLYLVETPKGKYVAAKVFEEGAPTADLLPGILLASLEALAFPKSMRWAALKKSFGRPVRWILALLGGALVDIEFANVKSSTKTFGHRFSAPGELEPTTIEEYFSTLEAADVIVDPARRRDAIVRLLAEQAEIAGGDIVDDPELVDEVSNLIELPNAVLVRFSQDYLELPDEVLVSSMRSHQRYFSIADRETGELLDACVVIYNTPVRDPDVVRAGNLRVLKARLDDARFFWDQDLKVGLEPRVAQLESVIWLRQLGSLLERSNRMKSLAEKIAGSLELASEQADAASRGAYLAKADLLTAMVYEFPDLQGVMGRAYAEKMGEPELVSQAIFEQYLPRGADDELPATDAGACVALAERLDALVGIFGVGLIPKSSADPYALRRAALGVLRIVQSRAYNLSISALVELAYDVYAEQGKTEAFELERAALIEQVREFITTRYKHLLGASWPSDVVDAVLSVAGDDVLAARDRVEALAALRGEDDFEPLAIGFKRVVNILRKQADAKYELPAAPDVALLTDEQEKDLHAQATAAKQTVEAAIETRDWAGACRALISLRGAIDAFFDHVMVMAEDEELRKNRLALLGMLRQTFMQVADISMIQTDA